MNILGTGLSGLVGQRVMRVLSDYTFTTLSRAEGVDITNYLALSTAFEQFDGKYVLHMAAKTSVDGCEADKDKRDNGEAWRINVFGTQNIAELCRKYDRTLIYISTDFVFEGAKPEGEGYSESDGRDPVNWYGKTKFEGEKLVQDAGIKYLILRVAYPYGISSAEKKDFVRIIASRLKEGKEIQGVTDHIMCPTYIDDIAHTIKHCITNNLEGEYHVVGSSSVTPYKAAQLIAEKVHADPQLISKVTRDEYFAGKASRPYNLYLKNDKIRGLGMSLKTFEEGLDEMVGAATI